MKELTHNELGMIFGGVTVEVKVTYDQYQKCHVVRNIAQCGIPVEVTETFTVYIDGKGKKKTGIAMNKVGEHLESLKKDQHKLNFRVEYNVY